MLGSTQQVAIKEYPLPTTAGTFTLDMASQRRIVGIVNKGGTNIVLSQERTDSSTPESSFELVESGTTVKLTHGYLSSVEYLGSFSVGDKLLHLFGEKTVQSEGGAL